MCSTKTINYTPLLAGCVQLMQINLYESKVCFRQANVLPSIDENIGSLWGLQGVIFRGVLLYYTVEYLIIYILQYNITLGLIIILNQGEFLFIASSGQNGWNYFPLIHTEQATGCFEKET